MRTFSGVHLLNIYRPGDRAREGISRAEAPLTGQTEREIAQLHAKEILWALFTEDKVEKEDEEVGEK